MDFSSKSKPDILLLLLLLVGLLACLLLALLEALVLANGDEKVKDTVLSLISFVASDFCDLLVILKSFNPDVSSASFEVMLISCFFQRCGYFAFVSVDNLMVYVCVSSNQRVCFLFLDALCYR